MTEWLAARLPPLRLGAMGWLRALSRAVPMALVVYFGLVVLLLVRLLEWPLHRPARPFSPGVTRAVCRLVLRLMGLPVTVTGLPMSAPGALVANHAGWLDIFVLNACTRLAFVAKSEVSGWPGIGLLARATGTLFITRKGAEAKRQQGLIEDRLLAGDRLLFFPEGTSTDALRILPFKSTLFAAFFAPALVHRMHLQPVTVTYHAPKGQDARLYGWWGDMAFAPHLLAVLALPRQGRVEVRFHPELRVAAFADRKALAQHCEEVIRAAHRPGAQGV
jgi:1-acyl-sn-glycerol-3-phosphate acyltransferase